MTEFELIDRLRLVFGTPDPPLVGIGDDAAVFAAPPGRDLIWTTDSFVEDFHFKKHWLSPKQIGRRAATAGLSDCAAMGATPRFALVTFHWPEAFDPEVILRIASGMQERFLEFGAAVLGGNLTGDRNFSIETAVLGEVPRGSARLRSGARPGDGLFVTGIPGTAALATCLLASGIPDFIPVHRWREAAPRIEQGEALRDLSSAAIDISDGLASDAAHMARASGVDIVLCAESLTCPPEYEQACRACAKPWHDFLLAPGDDYELLVAIPPQFRDRAMSVAPGALREIGKVVAGKGRVLFGYSGSETPINASGWDHSRRNT